ncbi:hypothetical protein CEK00_04700 [Stenotrophomonas maltophilia]|uniref:Uncharacterized protein n=1 Tax=Stenotrophomonas maltophilia TaxID=40324 RepID=A0A270NN66_STEMA|nr:hypothetical protein [Stenotrophomonas maltophilia]PAM73150.1 hypothetical protein CEK00_04700 [Stenotrophomonas maltophilia]
MATRIPLILNQVTERIEELAEGDTLPGSFIEGFSGKNRIINGNFDIYQRGNPGTITNTAAYTADRWICSSAGAGATSNWGLGATTPGEIPDSVLFLGFNVVAGVSSAWVGQWIEGVHTFAGGKATVSFWMRSGVAGKKVGLLIQQHFGTGGSAMVEVQASSAITLTTNFTKYTVTFDVPSIVGKTVGANNALLLTFFYADDRSSMFGGQLIGQTGLFEVAQVQMERGGKATDFEWRPKAEEQLLCERYCQLLDYGKGNGFTLCMVNGVNSVLAFLPLNSQMRVVPTATRRGDLPTYTGPGAGTGANLTALNIIPIGLSRLALVGTIGVSGTVNQVGYLGSTNVNGFQILLDSEF